MNNILPEGWINTNLADITKEGKIGLVRSVHLQHSDKGVSYIRMQHYNLQGQWNFNDLSKVEVTSKELEAYALEAGDILFNTRNSYELVGKVAIWPSNVNGYVYNNNLMRMRFSGNILPQWIAFQMIAPEFRKSLELVKSATTSVCAIYGKDLFQQNILLAPLNEQRRIISTIEQLTDRSHKARAALEDVPKLIAQFRQSVLAAAFRGDLTADWRAKNPDVEPASELLERIKIDRRDLWEKRQLEKMNIQSKYPINDRWKEKYQEPDLPNISTLPEIPNSWHWVKLISILLEVGDVDHKMPKAQEKGVPYISTRDFIDTGIIDFKGAKKISEEDFTSLCRKIYPEQGDILLSRYGTVGEVRIVSTGHPFQASYSIAILKKVSEELNKFIAIGLTSKPLQDQIKIWTRGAAQPDLGLAHIKEFAFPIPPEQEQQEILIRIESAMNSIDKIEREYKEMKGELNQLDRSILAKAFRGELVPQDPNDEPAAVLLERIRAERAGTERSRSDRTSTTKQRGKTTRKNSSKQLSIEGIE